MKINELLGKTITDSAAKNKKSEGQDFQKLLEQQLQNTSAPKESSESQSLNDKIPAAPPALRLHGLELTEQTLSTLESYNNALENLDIKASDLEPFVAALELETASILEVKNQLPPNDPLAKLLDQVATVGYLETVKYRRGDFLL